MNWEYLGSCHLFRSQSLTLMPRRSVATNETKLNTKGCSVFSLNSLFKVHVYFPKILHTVALIVKLALVAEA